MNKSLFIITCLICYACQSQSVEHKIDANQQSQSFSNIDSVLFQYYNDAFSNEFVIDKNLKLYYSVKRDETGKSALKPYRKSLYVDKNDLEYIINKIPSKLLDSSNNSYSKIGAPMEHDQGGYLLEIFKYNSSPNVIMIDGDSSKWPSDVGVYIKKLQSILIHCSK